MKSEKSFHPTDEEKLEYVALSKQGVTAVDIAKRFQRHPNTIRKWLLRFRQGGTTGLTAKKRPGRKPKKYEAVKLRLEQMLPKHPWQFGLPKDKKHKNWRFSMVFQFLNDKGLKISKYTLLSVLKREGWLDGSRESKYRPKEWYVKPEHHHPTDSP